jgi:hypothetical protein
MIGIEHLRNKARERDQRGKHPLAMLAHLLFHRLRHHLGG